jgi:hypothetical protein
MSTYDRVAALPLTVDGYALDGIARMASSGFERVTTVIRLSGERSGDERAARGRYDEGADEDVTLAPDPEPTGFRRR